MLGGWECSNTVCRLRCAQACDVASVDVADQVRTRICRWLYRPRRMCAMFFQAVTHVSQSGCGCCWFVELVYNDVLLSYVFVRCTLRVGSCRLRFGGLSALVRRRVLRKLSMNSRRFCVDRMFFMFRVLELIVFLTLIAFLIVLQCSFVA